MHLAGKSNRPAVPPEIGLPKPFCREGSQIRAAKLPPHYDGTFLAVVPLNMAGISHVATALPSHLLTQELAAKAVTHSLNLPAGRASAVHELFERSEVQTRYSVLDPAAIAKTRTLSETMRLYRLHAERLALKAAQNCLESAQLSPGEVDLVITCSCTGMLLPCLSVLIAKELGLRADVRRMPITEAGCAGGAYALARAHDYVRAFPSARVLIIAVELPSLTMQTSDQSSSNVVACALFGDGAAAALVEGTLVPSSAANARLNIVDTHTEVFPDSLHDLGFDLREGGLHIVLSRLVPEIISNHAPQTIARFLHKSGLSMRELSFFVLHPGGRKVIDALSLSLSLPEESTRISRDILRDYGNQSSVSVLFVLHQTLAEGAIDGFGLLAAFGPGITMELCLLQGQMAAGVPQRQGDLGMLAS
jgi:alkylresorcinol/alkylpyrone synthase